MGKLQNFADTTPAAPSVVGRNASHHSAILPTVCSRRGVMRAMGGGTETGAAHLPRAGRADVHLHTDEVDGLQSVGDLLDYAEPETDLDVVAVTDHDEIRGASKALDLAAQRNL